MSTFLSLLINHIQQASTREKKDVAIRNTIRNVSKEIINQTLQLSTSRQSTTGSAGWASWCHDTPATRNVFPRRWCSRELLILLRRCTRCLEEVSEVERTLTPTTRRSWPRYSTSTVEAATQGRWVRSTGEPRTRLQDRTQILRSPLCPPLDTSPAWPESRCLAVLVFSTRPPQVSSNFAPAVLNVALRINFCLAFCLAPCIFKISLFSFSF